MANPQFGKWHGDDDPADGPYGPQAGTGDVSGLEAGIIKNEEKSEPAEMEEVRNVVRKLRAYGVPVNLETICDALAEAGLDEDISVKMIKNILAEFELGLI